MIALALIVLLIVLILAVPVHLAVRAEWSERFVATWRVRALFGLIDFKSGGRARRPARPKPAKVKPARPRRAGHPLALLRTPGLSGRLARLFGDLARQLRVRTFEFDAEYGFDDPADTGIAVGVLAPVVVAARARGLDVRCAPSWVEPCFQGHCATSMSMRPLLVLGVIARFGCSRPVWRAIRAWRRPATDATLGG